MVASQHFCYRIQNYQHLWFWFCVGVIVWGFFVCLFACFLVFIFIQGFLCAFVCLFVFGGGGATSIHNAVLKKKKLWFMYYSSH